MKILGITGGVGSGKSKVLYELKEKYNAFVVEADKVAHELMEPGKPIYNEIVAAFGKDILCEEEPYQIDRAALGFVVFNDKNYLERLNSITHPAVKLYIKELIKDKEDNQSVKLFVIEAALLIETGYSDICDEIWYVWVDKEERINRLMESRGYTREKCLSIFENQQSDDYYKKYANVTINNQNSFDITSKQLKDLLNKFMEDDIIS
ncbi:MAG: dephospho-CoA kinase [Lachnospiraceae bacterium]|nr:dephospho-CoA kinase [Lachnospiraceae bacterium]MBQ8318462.1 dephospho-CoA kinase [Lachnospiraceae bacterium]